MKFYAVLGNHDDPQQVAYPLFNMNRERYYSFAPPEDLLAKIVTRVEFFALDSTNLDRTQLRWLDERLAASRAAWKVCFFHHPLYTSGRYRTQARLHRLILEPLPVEHGVDVAFSGHDHIYQRITLQRGIQYFVSGGAGSLRPGDGAPATYVASTFDRDYHFMLIEIEADRLHFQAISRAGYTIDAVPTPASAIALRMLQSDARTEPSIAWRSARRSYLAITSGQGPTGCSDVRLIALSFVARKISPLASTF